MENKKAFSLIEISVVILIIGILILGVSKGIDLYNSYLISNARALTRSSVVPRIEGLGFWVDSTSEKSYEKTKLSDGLAVMPWNDINPLNTEKLQVKNGWNLWYYENQINGLPAASTGNNSFLVNISTDDLSSFNLLPDGGITIFAVLKCRPYKWLTGEDTPCGAPLEVRSSDALYYYNISQMWGSLNFSINTKLGYNSITYDYSDQLSYKPAIITFRASDSKLIINLNGKLVKSEDPASSIGTFNNPLKILIGHSSGHSTSWRYFKGFIGELIVYGNPIPDGKVRLVEQYLSQKWRIPLD